MLLIKSFELTFASLLPLESFFSSSSILFSISSISIFCFIPHDGPLISFNDYKIAVTSRECSILGRREVLTGKAKFGIFGDGKEVP